MVELRTQPIVAAELVPRVTSCLDFLAKNSRKLNLGVHGVEALRDRKIAVMVYSFPNKTKPSLLVVYQDDDQKPLQTRGFVNHTTTGELVETSKDVFNGMNGTRLGLFIAHSDENTPMELLRQEGMHKVFETGFPVRVLNNRSENITIKDEFTGKSITLFTAFGQFA